MSNEQPQQPLTWDELKVIADNLIEEIEDIIEKYRHLQTPTK